ncbi:MAG: indolepyruvate ferredoxin oxidoreductase subunit alpha [candidate division KSB1 bacterium]|nr:indolepyruvate ferredoxin oxidoreductase subunit alpha [candidate division KSB1 bacterium]
MKHLLSGNEAVARGAWEAGVEIAAAYPGTPSTEIMANVATYDEIYAEWSVNEKVAFEVAYGAAIGGRRALAAMKHVGVNVAADALMTSSYIGTNAGFVLAVADDPGMHSSQNEQDTRIYARFAQVPLLEPGSSQEAKDMVVQAFEISEQFDTPVILRLSTRICHGKGVVEFKDRVVPAQKAYRKDAKKYVMVPAHARGRHVQVRERTNALLEYSESSPLNVVTKCDSQVGVITSGVSYTYAREVFPQASFFKLGVSHPLPIATLTEFAKQHKTVYVIEELEPVIEDELKKQGIEVIGKNKLPCTGEYSPELLRQNLLGAQPTEPESGLPGRPPVMCAGCPHRAVFSVLKSMNAVVSGDIGCYTLSTLPPLNTMDTCLCMGASVGLAQGLVRSLPQRKAKKTVSVLGDSTFIHSGIPSLANAVYNQANITLIILDNRITAMTGHQDNPGTGKTLKGKTVPEFNFEAVARVMGAGFVRSIDPIDKDLTHETIQSAMEFDGPAVVVAKRPCVLVDRQQFEGHMQIDPELCTECKRCLQIGCPSISIHDGKVVIDDSMCFGCSVCQQICPSDAIRRVK